MHSARVALRPGPDGGIDTQVLIGVTQGISIPVDPAVPNGDTMTFEGGSSIVGDLRLLKIRYSIRKNVRSTTRLARQQAFAAASLDSARATYFDVDDALEPFAAMHRGLER